LGTANSRFETKNKVAHYQISNLESFLRHAPLQFFESVYDDADFSRGFSGRFAGGRDLFHHQEALAVRADVPGSAIGRESGDILSAKKNPGRSGAEGG
jgi:hypothetical protein